jgi:hypothetical protein
MIKPTLGKHIIFIHLHVAGQKYAMLEIKATVCQLLRNYKLLPGTTPLDITNELVLKSTTGINVILEARENT